MSNILYSRSQISGVSPTSRISEIILYSNNNFLDLKQSHNFQNLSSKIQIPWLAISADLDLTHF